MKTIATPIAALFAIAFLSMPVAGETTASPGRPTTKCNATPTDRGIWMQYAVPSSDPLVVAMFEAANNPASNPTLHERMGKPQRAQAFSSGLILVYDAVQDMEEMRARFAADTELASRFEWVRVSSPFWGYPTQPAPAQVIREYYNAALDHYYMASVPAEIEWLDAGGGGGGWVRTDYAWNTFESGMPERYAPDYRPVYMFYGTPGIGPNSHYFTASPEECGYLRNTVGWSFVAIPFGAKRPVNGVCPSDAPAALMLLYNNRAAQNDSNHRYTSNSTVYAQMQAKGWTGYGVQLCVKEVIGPW